jgi:hypothetical protein
VRVGASVEQIDAVLVRRDLMGLTSKEQTAHVWGEVPDSNNCLNASDRSSTLEGCFPKNFT